LASEGRYGYAIDKFDIDWEARTITCPQGHTTADWTPAHNAKNNPVVRVRFACSVCASCKVRLLCTRAVKDGRSMTLHANRIQYQVLRDTRQQQEIPQWKERYAKRSGVEGTLSQGIRAFDLRQTRYIGLSKTHLQHILTAAAINLVRVDNWLTGIPIAKTRISRFKAIKPKAA